MAAVSRQVWLSGLPAIVDDLARRWTLEVGSPFQPAGVASWVAPVRRGTEELVLKVAWLHEESLHEATGLRAWQGNGAVRLIESVIPGPATAGLLLEACRPGTSLSACLPPLDQDVVVAGLLRQLWIAPPDGHPFRPLRDMCDRWADEYQEKLAAVARPRMDPGLARAAIDVLRTLPDAADRHVLLCTDLHAGNVLAAQRRPWLVIDPKPYVGDPTYDPLQYMLNFPKRLMADPVGFAERMAGLLDLDRQRLKQWLFARCVQESIELPYLLGPARRLAP